MARRHQSIGDSAELATLARGKRALGSVADDVAGQAMDTVARKRQLVADFCRLIGHRLAGDETATSRISSGPSSADAGELPPLSPRMRQTLDALLDGDSEKQIARKLSLSKHTVHVYVKAIYRGFAVNSRGELLSRFVSRRASA